MKWLYPQFTLAFLDVAHFGLTIISTSFNVLQKAEIYKILYNLFFILCIYTYVEEDKQQWKALVKTNQQFGFH